MTNERTNVPSTSELVDAWLQTATQAERQWNEYLNQVMGTDAFAQMMARSMESSAAIQAAFARSMEPYLRALNIPTNADLARLTERLTMLEQRVDALTVRDDLAIADEGQRSPTKRQARSRRT